MMKPLAMIGLLAATPVFIAATPVAAQSGFALPAGCSAHLTIQMNSCTVSHHYRCLGDPVGQKWRADMDESGLTYVGRTDDEAQWIESFHISTSHSEQFGGAVDPMSFSELIANGVDTWDFETTSAEIGTSRYAGMDRLTGEQVVIDGVTLLQTEYALTAYGPDGRETWRSSGREYASAEWRMFLSGISTYVTSDDDFETDNTPVEFIFPGEAGFLSTMPKYGCGAQMSSYRAAQ